MSFGFFSHWDACFLIPTIVLSQEQCPDPDCGAQHYLISLSWLCWTASLMIDAE